jgi:hypothetical protein
MNDHETRVVGLLDRATSDLTPDVDRIVAGAIVRGGALRRRARVATTLAATAVIGVTGLAATLLPGGGDGRGRDEASVASEPATGRSPLASTLASLLPDGRATALADEHGRGYDRGGLLYRGTRVYVYVYRATSCDTAPLLTDVGCYDLDPGGTRPRSVAGTETSADGQQLRRRSEADLTRPDGWRVSVVATNDREAGGPVVTPDPALSWAQLLRIARADVWFPDVATASPSTAPTATPTPTSSPVSINRIAVTAEQVPGTVERLLGRRDAGPLRTAPAYGAVSEPQRVIAHFSWRGTLATVVIVRSDGDVKRRCEQSAERDGTCTADAAGHPMLLWGPTTGDGVAAQGATVWRDGFEVSLLSYNAEEGKGTPPLFEQPPLTLDDLALLAASDAWFA